MTTSLASTFSPALLQAYRQCATAVISDNLERAPGAVGLRPWHRVQGVMVGRALTVQTRSGDNAFIHKALDLVEPGDVIVVDGGGDVGRALIGEIMTSIAKSRGAAGFVLDGAIRDSAAIGADTFACYARAVTHRGPYKNGPGRINVPVTVGGMLVNPGDLVVGDADGVVAIAPELAGELLGAVQAQELREQEILASIRAGTYTNAYAK